MSGPDDEHLAWAQSELGDPDALFQVSRGRFLAKLGVGLLLLLYGVVANYLWWVHGPATFGHIELILLIVVPGSGAALLLHMYRNRGLSVLVYRGGLLRLCRGEFATFPWDEVEHVRLKVQRADEASVERDGAGNTVGCWLPAEVPTFQLWNGGLTLARADGVETTLNPALSDFDRLAEEVQRRTFAALWPGVWARFRAGESVRFGDLAVGPAGLRHEGKFLAWKDLKELTVAQGKLSVKQTGKWLPWLLLDVNGVPNPHVLFALVAEARKLHAVAPVSQPHGAAADHGSEDE